MAIIPTKFVPCLVVLSLAAMAGTVDAQSSSPVMQDISACMQITGDAEKYSCYLKLEAAVRAEHAKTGPASAPAAPASATNGKPAAASGKDAVAGFGNRLPSADSFEVRANPQGTMELHDSIAELKEREPNRLLITLANGQVWYQSNSQYFHLLKGTAVRIYPSPLHGSYRLARDDGKETGFIQVERLK